MSNDHPKSDTFVAQRRQDRGLSRLREGYTLGAIGQQETRGLLPRSRSWRFSGFFYSLVRRLYNSPKFVATELAWWTAAAGHLLGEQENEVTMNRFLGPLLAGVVSDYDAFL